MRDTGGSQCRGTHIENMNETSLPKRVWILGAGFSRPLGGPLLADLLSDRALHQIRLRYGAKGEELVEARPSRMVKWLYDLGNPKIEGRLLSGYEDWDKSSYPPDINIHRTWDNAEDFLVWLDDAANNRHGNATQEYQWILTEATRLANRGPAELPTFLSPPKSNKLWWSELPAKLTWRHAKLLLAAETSAFLYKHDTRLDLEKWFPIVNWIESLTCSDVILSFNYDRVIECADQQHARSESNQQICVPTNKEFLNNAKGLMPLLLKLHGSASWQLRDSNIVDTACLELSDGKFDTMIACPGQSKLDSTTGALAFLWEPVAATISEADEVWIIGYSFPRSDTYTKSTILGAIRDNPNDPKINIIVGQSNPDAVRVREMLGLVVRSPTNIRVLEMWTEDYLATIAFR